MSIDYGANKMTTDTLSQWSIKLDNQTRARKQVLETRKWGLRLYRTTSKTTQNTILVLMTMRGLA